ncbi:hypothetical protein BGZ61DRAFT_554953 [Ilyonectria robusta]|uniref:uncharacterized protein n=1 Tax=Ilyonectria robusta TaxID=1079257 RepID=UPI001E8DD61F|nr:uncharacterized protein BGZ61DRAFT_554953 [Ilyonectria robusta]KAH8675053.1 hypothetical protein BGZ61DRAFT_554953 [Ilyonectria robusta]
MSLVVTSFPLTSSVSPSILVLDSGSIDFPGKSTPCCHVSPEAAQAPSWPIVQSLGLIVRLRCLPHTALTGRMRTTQLTTRIASLFIVVRTNLATGKRSEETEGGDPAKASRRRRRSRPERRCPLGTFYPHLPPTLLEPGRPPTWGTWDSGDGGAQLEVSAHGNRPLRIPYGPPSPPSSSTHFPFLNLRAWVLGAGSVPSEPAVRRMMESMTVTVTVTAPVLHSPFSILHCAVALFAPSCTAASSSSQLPPPSSPSSPQRALTPSRSPDSPPTLLSLLSLPSPSRLTPTSLSSLFSSISLFLKSSPFHTPSSPSTMVRSRRGQPEEEEELVSLPEDSDAEEEEEYISTGDEAGGAEEEEESEEDADEEEDEEAEEGDKPNGKAEAKAKPTNGAKAKADDEEEEDDEEDAEGADDDEAPKANGEAKETNGKRDTAAANEDAPADGARFASASGGMYTGVDVSWAMGSGWG